MDNLTGILQAFIDFLTNLFAAISEFTGKDIFSMPSINITGDNTSDNTGDNTGN